MSTKGTTQQQRKMDDAGAESKKPFSRTVFENLLRHMCSEPEICAVFACAPATLRRWVRGTYGKPYVQVAEEYKASGKSKLRELGFKHAEKNPIVWIFMAKNYLGMSDNPAPVDTGEKRREFESAVKTASKALATMDISSMADIPPRRSRTEEAGDGEEKS